MNSRTVVALEQRFQRTADGKVWTDTGYARRYWDRYLKHSDQVVLAARATLTPEPRPGSNRVDGDGVTLLEVPHYLGSRELLGVLRRVRLTLESATAASDVTIARGPGIIGGMLVDIRRKRQWPYGVEVLGDPYDVFAPGGVGGLLRPIIRHALFRSQQRQCWNADAALYVTRDALQRRYPCRGVMVSASDVELPADAFAHQPRRFVQQPVPLRIIVVGSLAQRYKGVDLLVRAHRLCADENFRLQTTVVGDGQFKAELEHLATQLGIAHDVNFVGAVRSGAPVRALLDSADLFVLPSRTEGLPRSLLEAMARGLPAIGTRVGGIPELLHPEDLVDPGNHEALAAALSARAADPRRLTDSAERNLTKAREYADALLEPRRDGFLQLLGELSARRNNGV